MSRSTSAPAITDRFRRAARAALGELRPPRPSAPAATPPPPEQAGDEGPATDAPVRAAHSPVPPLDLTVAVAATSRLTDLLAPEWAQRELGPDTWSTDIAGVDLVVLEGREGSVPGWSVSTLTDLLTAAKGASVPTVLWVTDDIAPDSWSAGVSAVGASSDRLREALSLSGTRAHHWAPAAQPRSSGLGREDATTDRRSGALVVVDGLSRLGDDSSLRLIDEALEPMAKPSTRVVLHPDATAGDLTLPRGLAQRTGEGSVAGASVLLDQSSTSPAAAWSTVAAAAAQTPVVGTTPGSDLPPEIEALVPRVDTAKDLRGELVARVHQEELVAREGLQLQRAVLAGHTGAHRARELAAAAGLVLPSLSPATVSAVVPTNRTHELDNVFANLGRQDHPAVELVLVLHGLDTDDADLRRRAHEAGVQELQIVHADASLTLGACMNLGIDSAGGEFIAKMDDDNIYGVRYLSDLLAAFSFTDAGIVGKWAHYVWLRSTGAVVLRYPDSEHRYERRIQGGSMLFAGDVARRLRFSDIPRAVDSDILDRALAEGIRVYSGDRYNYVSLRGDDRHSHTWTVSDSTFLTATGRLLFYGDPTSHVSL